MMILTLPLLISLRFSTDSPRRSQEMLGEQLGEPRALCSSGLPCLEAEKKSRVRRFGWVGFVWFDGFVGVFGWFGLVWFVGL